MMTYTAWTEVPSHLKTKTGIRNAGKRRRPRQPVVARIDTRFKRYGGIYDLYDLNACLEKRPVSDKQRAAFEKIREKSHCDVCGRHGVTTNNGGFCSRCQRWLDEEAAKVRRREAERKENRGHVTQWAQGVLSGPFVVLDTETTGLTPGSIVDLAIVDGLTGDVLLDTLLNPGEPIPPAATHIHKITDSMVQHAPTFAEIMPEVERILADTLCIMYNEAFDVGFLRAEGLDVDRYQFDCLMLQYARYAGEYSEYYGDWKFQSLETACQSFRISTLGIHRARVDALATLYLLQAVARGEAS